MAQSVCVVVNTADREQLAAIVADRNRPRKHVERVRIVLAFGRSRVGADGGAHGRGQPADGVATAICRGRGRGPVAR